MLSRSRIYRQEVRRDCAGAGGFGVITVHVVVAAVGLEEITRKNK